MVAGESPRCRRARSRPQSSPVSSRQRSPASRAIGAASSKRASMVSSQARASSVPGVRVLGQERVERAQRLVRRPRPEDERALEAEEIRAALAGQPGVVERLLRRVRLVLVAARGSSRPRSASADQTCTSPAWSSACSSSGSASRASCSSSSMAGSAANDDAVVGGADTGERLACLVAGCPRPLGGGVGDRCGLRASLVEERLRRGRARARRRAVPAGSARAPARAARRRPGRRRARARGGRRPRAARRRARPGSGRVVRARCCSGRPARGGSRGSRPARPARRRAAPASRRSARAAPPARLWGARRRRRRGSAGGGSGSRPRPRTAPCRGGSAAVRTSAARRGVTWVSSGASACTAPRWKTSPSTAPRSSTRRSAGVELVEAGREQRLQASAAPRPRLRASPAIASISPMNSGLPPPQPRSSRAAPPARAAPIRLSASSPLSGSSRSVTGQEGRLSSSSARHAEQQERGAAGEQRDVLDQVEERLLAPLDVVEHDDERRLLLEQLAERPGDLLRRRARLRLAEQRTDRRRGRRIGRQHVELLHDLDDRPVGDPDPVGQAAAANDPRLDRGERLRREPRLADARRHRRS